MALEPEVKHWHYVRVVKIGDAFWIIRLNEGDEEIERLEGPAHVAAAIAIAVRLFPHLAVRWPDEED